MQRYNFLLKCSKKCFTKYSVTIYYNYLPKSRTNRLVRLLTTITHKKIVSLRNIAKNTKIQRITCPKYGR